MMAPAGISSHISIPSVRTWALLGYKYYCIIHFSLYCFHFTVEFDICV